MFLDERMREAYKKFYKLINKDDDSPMDSSTCIYLLENFLPYSSGRVFVDRTFPIHDQTKSMVASMVNSVIWAFKDTLNKLPWMDSTSKANANRKADYVTVNPMFPDFTFDDDALNDLYGDLMINASDTFFNIYNYLQEYQTTKSFRLLLNNTVPDHSDFH